MIDLSLGRESGLTLLRDLRDFGCEVPLLVYSMHEDAFHIEQALSAGAAGYVTKRELPSVLALAIKEVLEGAKYVGPRAAAVLEASGDRGCAPEALSARELQVYTYLGHGYTTAGIAEKLDVSRRTVDSYYARIIEKLKLRGMEELRRHAAGARETQ